jgi:uncharacterized Zn finger protein
MEKINKCPKCGREPKIILIQSRLTLDGFVLIECQKCGIKVTHDSESEEVAIEKWNKLTEAENDKHV